MATQNMPTQNMANASPSTNNAPIDNSPIESQAASTQPDLSLLKSFSTEALAQALAEKLAITPGDWHRLSSNRHVRAREQAAAALVYMLKNQPDEAIPRLSQAIGWLNKTLKAPPCPTHAEKRQK